MGNSSRGQPDASDGAREEASHYSAVLSRGDLLARAAVGAALISAPSWVPSLAKASTKTRHTRSQRGKTLVVAGDSVGSDLVPTHIFQGWLHVTALTLLFEGLYGFANEDVRTKIIPVLARDYPRQDKRNRRQFAVDLRRGVRFHDGTAFDAEAVEFNYQRYLDKTHPFYDPAAIYAGGWVLWGIAKVEALDRYTVVFTTNRPLGSLMEQLVSPVGAGILSPAAIRAAGVANAGLAPQGTGPFRLIEARRGDQIVLERFEDYWGRKAQVDRIVLRAIPDPAALTASLLSGEVHMSWFVSLDDAARFERDRRFNTVAQPSVSAGYIALNAGGSRGVSTFLDRRFRLAALTAINKEKLIRSVLAGRAVVGAGLLAPPSWGYQPALRDYHKYNPSRARALLAQLRDIPPVTLSVPSSAHWPRAAESVQADWEAVGIKTNIRVVEAAAFGATMTQGAHDAFMWDLTPPSPAPLAVYRAHFGCQNTLRFRVGGWCDQDWDRKVIAASRLRDRGRVKRIILELDRALLDNAVKQVNYYPMIVSVWRKNVTGFRPPIHRYAGLRNVAVS